MEGRAADTSWHTTHTIMAQKNWKPIFLDALRAGHTVTYAARRAGVGRRTVYQHRNRSAEFARQWDEAAQEGLDNLLEIMLSRATDPSDKSSAQLLMFLVKARLQMLRFDQDDVVID